MRIFSTSLILLVALINLAPMIGVLSADRLTSLYGIAFDGPDLQILMRHRAVLLGIVGGLLVVSAFQPSVRQFVFAAAWISMLSFVVVAALVGDANAELRRVAAIDMAASVALLGAAIVDGLAGSDSGAN
jgi:hypothetical protein